MTERTKALKRFTPADAQRLATLPQEMDIALQTYTRIWKIIDRDKLRQYCEEEWGRQVPIEASDYLGRLLARRVAQFKDYLPSGKLTVQSMWTAAGRFF